MSLEFNGIKLFPISELQVSQIFLNKRKIDDIYKWFKPKDVKNYEPLPVHDFGDGKYTLTDGHSRAYVAFKEGVTHIHIVYDNDDIVVSESGLLQYSHNLLWCRRFNVNTIADFDDRIVSDRQYKKLWIERCDKSYNLLSQTTEAERDILAKKQESLFLFGASEDLSLIYFEDINGKFFEIKNK